jgi:hypothetical protein
MASPATVGPRLAAAALARSRAVRLVAAFLATRAIVEIVLVGAIHRRGRTFSATLESFDGSWYQRIAAYGYPAQLPPGPHGIGQNSTAFFPLFPVLVSVVSAAGISFSVAATAVNLAAGAAAVVVIDAAVRRYADERTAAVTALLWAVQPMAFVLSLAYSEALFTLFVAAALLAMLDRRWWLAGTWTALASATRPSGLVLVLAAAAAVGVDWRRTGRLAPRSLAAVALAPLGAVAYFGYLGARTGHLDAWWRTEHDGWAVYTDGGRATLHRFAHYLTHPTERPAATAVGLVIVVLAVLAVATLADHAPVPVAVFCIVSLLLAVTTSNAYSSIPRFALPAFGLLVPVASRVQRLPTWVLAVLAAAAACASAGFGAYAMLWSHYPP